MVPATYSCKHRVKAEKLTLELRGEGGGARMPYPSLGRQILNDHIFTDTESNPFDSMLISFYRNM